MEENVHKKLDNPVWYSLQETHKTVAIADEGIAFYDPDHCPFGGFIQLQHTARACGNYSTRCERFFIVGEQPMLPDFLKVDRQLICLQMTIDQPIRVSASEEIVQLTPAHQGALFELVNKVQPGYFRNKTFLLGAYYGILKNGSLVAAAGERMKMDHFTEVSAIVTHPEYTGKGFASQLTAHITNIIFSQNKQPYLHVVESNQHAISLYEKLGFKIRRKISFWNICHTH